MKILYVVGSFPCVSETFVLNQITGLLDQGHDVEIYGLNEPVQTVVHQDVYEYGLLEQCWKRVEVPKNKVYRSLKAILLMLIYIWIAPITLLKTLNFRKYGVSALSLTLFYTVLPLIINSRRFKTDVVLVHFGDLGVLVNMWAEIGALNRPFGVVFHAHEMCTKTNEEYIEYYGPLFKSNALILPISNYWRKLLLSWGAKEEKVVVHRMGVDCKRIEYKPKMYNEKEGLNILTVARFAESKGIEYAIRAVAQLRDSITNIKYWIAGDGPIRESLERLVRELNLTENVEFLGPKPQEQVYELLHNSHIFLSPHVTAQDGTKEGIPVAIMEAMASGTIVVSTRHSGIPEIIDDGVNGFLSEERDVQGIVSNILGVVENPRAMEQISLSARAKVEKDYNTKTLNDRLADLLRNHANVDNQG